jgi:8-oxo-dGTP pyrophosphatase MutT (NUDIX family)
MGRKFQLCGASVIIYKDQQVLLQQRTDNKCWGYHGGAVEMGEKVEAAAKRELYEETGLTAKSLTLFGVFSGPEQYHVYPDGNEAYIIDIVYLCNDFEGELRRQENEVLDLAWFDMDKLPENLSPPIKTALLQFCRESLSTR